MRRFLQELQDFPKKGDWILLLLCLITSGFGCIAIASATNAEKFGDNNIKYIIIQLAATALGVLMFAIMSSLKLYLVYSISVQCFGKSFNKSCYPCFENI